MLGLDVCEFGGQMLELLWLTMCYRGLLTDKNNLAVEDEDDERNLNYNPPAQKSLQEIQEMDKDDESLVKYKQTLLGPDALSAGHSGPIVKVTRLTLLCDSAPEPVTMDLTGDLSSLKEKNFTLQEGVDYRIKINFKVSKDIVSGLKYRHVTYRKGVRINKLVCMVGSYGPREEEEQEFLCLPDDVPKGLLTRGQYLIKSCFTDDDKNIYLSWEWNLNISKDWN